MAVLGVRLYSEFVSKNGGISSGVASSQGGGAIGGAFELVDQDGAPFTQASLNGQFSLIYFGFTYCPDICPLTLQTLGKAMDVLGDDRQSVQTILISVDPERDTAEALKTYIASNGFPDDLIGLTGTPEQISAAAKAYKVYYAKVETQGASEYLIDHTGIVYLMDKRGEFAAAFSHTASPDEIAGKIQDLIASS